MSDSYLLLLDSLTREPKIVVHISKQNLLQPIFTDVDVYIASIFRIYVTINCSHAGTTDLYICICISY